MSHHHQRDHKHHPQQPAGPSRRFSAGHILKVLLLNCVLYLACGAFAGMIAGDYLNGPWEFRIVAGFILVPLAIAVVSTVVHVWMHRWGPMDDMSERFFGGKHGGQGGQGGHGS